MPSTMHLDLNNNSPRKANNGGRNEPHPQQQTTRQRARGHLFKGRKLHKRGPPCAAVRSGDCLLLLAGARRELSRERVRESGPLFPNSRRKLRCSRITGGTKNSGHARAPRCRCDYILEIAAPRCIFAPLGLADFDGWYVRDLVGAVDWVERIFPWELGMVGEGKSRGMRLIAAECFC